MEALLESIRQCRHCEKYLEPRPVVQASATSRVLIIGQAPGRKVHESGVPWDDASGRLLRDWMQVEPSTFYDAEQVAIVPMGFCYPGKGKSGDLPPRKECAPLWHDALRAQMPQIELTLLIGQYAQKEYLGERFQTNLTETVRAYESFLPDVIPLPHPSPRNRFWLQKHPWFEAEVLPILRQRLHDILPQSEQA